MLRFLSLTEQTHAGDGDDAETITRLWRVPVLEEILNLGRYVFSARDHLGSVAWRPNAALRIAGGVPRNDIEALLRLRRFRRARTDSLEAQAEKSMLEGSDEQSSAPDSSTLFSD